MVLGAIILYSGMEGVVIPLTTFIYFSSHGFVSLTHKLQIFVREAVKRKAVETLFPHIPYPKVQK